MKNVITQFFPIRKIFPKRFDLILHDNLEEKFQEFLKLKDEYNKNSKEDSQLRKKLINSITCSNPKSQVSQPELIQRSVAQLEVQQNLIVEDAKNRSVNKSNDNIYPSSFNSSFMPNLISKQESQNKLDNSIFEDKKEEILKLRKKARNDTKNSKQEKDSSTQAVPPQQTYIHDIDPKNSSDLLISRLPISLDFLSESEEEKDEKEVKENQANNESRKNNNKYIYNPFTVRNILTNFSKTNQDQQIERQKPLKTHDNNKSNLTKERNSLEINPKMCTKQEIDKISYSKIFKKIDLSDCEDEDIDEDEVNAQKKLTKLFHN